MESKRKLQDSENAGPAPKKIMFEGQVVKLTKDGEPDMRFTVSNKFVAMLQTAEKALGIDLILKKVFENLLYRDLKNARRVNTFWNRIANPVFRKRSIRRRFKDKDGKIQNIRFSNCQHFIEEEAALPNQNLVAKVPFSIGLFSRNRQAESRALIAAIQATPTWFPRVSKLHLHFSPIVSVEQLNRILPVLLHRMPVLQVLCMRNGPPNPHSGMGDLALARNLILPAVPADAEFSLTNVFISFSFFDFVSHFDAPLDTEFLRHCPNLKTCKVLVRTEDTGFKNYIR